MIFVHALGTAQIDAGTARVTPTSVRRFALLLYLAAEAGRRVSRTTLHELICPDQTEKNARHTLRELLYKIRQAGVLVLSDAHGVQLTAETVRSDYADLMETSHISDNQLHAVEGGFLPGYSPTHSEAFAEWYEAHRAKTAFALCKSVVRQMNRAKSAGNWQFAEKAARACLALDSLHEEATLVLAEMLAIGGAKVQAVNLLDGYINDVGGNRDLRLSAAVLRRRISERASEKYAGTADSMPFVGRESEMAALQYAAREASAGIRRCVVISGEPGIGKSRLLDEFREWLSLTNASVATVTAREHEQAKPLAVVADLARQLLALPGSLACNPQAMDALKYFFMLADQQTSGSRARQLPVSEIIWALCDVAEAVHAEAPLAILCDDSQWLDRASARTLVALSRASPSSRFLLVVSTRDRDAWQSMPGAIYDRHISLERLTAAAVGALVSATFKRAHTDEMTDLLTWMGSTCEGNPLFLATLVRHYERTGERFTIPLALTELLARRLGSVGSESLRLLRVAAVLGKHATVERVCQAMKVDGSRVLKAVEELEHAHIIRTNSSTITPAHQLVSEAALRDCSAVWLSTAHRIAAQALAGSPGGMDATIRWDCADHWAKAAEHERAIALFEQIARDANSVGQPVSAAETLSRAIELPSSNTTRERIAREVIRLGDVLGDSALISRGSNALQTIGARFAHDDTELAVLRALWVPTMPEEAIEAKLLECITSAQAGAEHRVQAAIQALKYADVRGRDRLIAAVFDCLDGASLLQVEEVLRLEYLMIAAVVRNQSVESVRCAREIVTVSCRVEHAHRCKHQINAAIVLVRAGFDHEALDVLQDCLTEARRIKAIEMQNRTQLFRASILLDWHCDNEALAELRECEPLIARDPFSLGYEEYLALRIDTALAVGDVPTASRLLEEHGAGRYTGSAVGQRWHRAFEARIKQVTTSGPLDDDSIDQIAREQPVGASSGLSDLEAAVVCFEHVRRGSASMAIDVARDHLARRSHKWKNRPARSFSDAFSLATCAVEGLPTGQDDAIR